MLEQPAMCCAYLLCLYMVETGSDMGLITSIFAALFVYTRLDK